MAIDDDEKAQLVNRDNENVHINIVKHDKPIRERKEKYEAKSEGRESLPSDNSPAL